MTMKNMPRAIESQITHSALLYDCSKFVALPVGRELRNDTVLCTSATDSMELSGGLVGVTRRMSFSFFEKLQKIVELVIISGVDGEEDPVVSRRREHRAVTVTINSN